MDKFRAYDFVEKYPYNEVFLFDLSWHLHRSYHVFPEDRFHATIDGEVVPTGHLFGVIKAVTTVRDRYPNSLIVMCEDGFPVRRHELMGNKVVKNEKGYYQLDAPAAYKADRPSLGFNFYKDTEILEKMLSIVPNLMFAYHPEEEADDLMYSLAKLYGEKGSFCYIYSGDDDLLQSITDKICVIRHIDKKTRDFIIMDEAFTLNSDKFGLLPNQLPLYRSIVGDTSDKIAGVCPRFSRAVARLVATIVKTPSEFIELAKTKKPSDFLPVDKVSETTFTKYWNVLLESSEIWERNYQMMKLRVFDFDMYRNKRDIKGVFKLLDDYNMRHLQKYLYSIGITRKEATYGKL